ncbi:hypothetical protein KFK09_009585 [Dendrobium nobile]|uniref:Uncharacterized protein n=1 Tax=Dendrobium nobile TaxID=94219 RepID=A0A8T3BHV6_DENNO|nr:hypothetical protein KFK09_009585 [Dendrobium nobile]
MQKYCMLFRKSVNMKKKKAISYLLKFKIVKEMTYLGVKIALRRLVASYFQNLVEKALNKLNVLGNRFISLEGRIVLVKSAFLSLCILLLMHLLVPMGILNDFDRLCRFFIWHKQDGNQGLHYVAWEVLSK